MTINVVNNNNNNNNNNNIFKINGLTGALIVFILFYINIIFLFF